MNDIPTIAAHSMTRRRGTEPITTDQTLRVLAFVLVVFPTAVAVNVVLWSLAARLWGE